MTSVKSHPAREAARAAGHKTYTTGVKCANAHLSPRLVANGNCKECDLASQWMRRTGKSRKAFEEMRAARRDTGVVQPLSVRKARAVRREIKPPTIGRELDEQDNTRKLIRTNTKFLRALVTEKLTAIRSGVSNES